MADSSKPQIALITGATGFIGSHLARRLLRERWEVHIITRQQSSLTLLGETSKAIKQHYYDYTTESLVDIVDAVQPDIVFHLASLALANHTAADIRPLIEANVLLGTQLLEAMHIQRAYRLINTGTYWQHFNNASYSPVCLYAATKQAFDAIITYYVETAAFNVITLSLFDTYGENDPRPKLLNQLQSAWQSNKRLTMSPGDQLIDLVHVDDVVEAFVLAAERLRASDGAGHVEYAVSSGNPISLRELVALCEEIVGATLPIIWGGRPYRDREVMVPWNTGKCLPGWVPRIPIREGLTRLLTNPLDHQGC